VVGAAAAAQGDPKKVIVPAVQAQAKAINIQRSDLPGTGWTSKPPTPDDSNPRCSYYNPDQSDLTENGDADSAEFSHGQEAVVSSSTSIFASAAQGRTAYARVVRPDLPKCLAELFRKGTGQAARFTIVSVAPLSFAKLADKTNAYRIVTDYRASTGQKVRVTFDIVVLNRGKVDVALLFLRIGGAFSASFERGIASKVAARMATVH
jgi:hypothetical protein